MKSNVIECAVNDATEMLTNGVATPQILTHLVNAAEKVIGEESVSSILVLDNDGLLRNGASPHLPHDYLTARDVTASMSAWRGVLF